MNVLMDVSIVGNVEDLDQKEPEMAQTHISDRMIRNNSIHTPQRMNEILEKPWNFDVNPEYIEVAFF